MFGIDGLLYIPDYLAPSEHDALVQTIEGQLWRYDLARRTQQYGYLYEHKRKALNTSDYLGPLPAWLQRLGTQMQRDGILPDLPDQAIINEYEPGQGIGKHIDATPAFGEVVISLSLLSLAVMDLRRSGGEEHIAIPLEPRSLLILLGEARHVWTHGVAPRHEDFVNGVFVPRKRRISVTFRTVTHPAA